MVPSPRGRGLVGFRIPWRDACRKFVGDTSTIGSETELLSFRDMLGAGGWVFNRALGELRGVIGVRIAQLSVRYGLDVPDALVATLPTTDSA